MNEGNVLTFPGNVGSLQRNFLTQRVTLELQDFSLAISGQGRLLGTSQITPTRLPHPRSHPARASRQRKESLGDCPPSFLLVKMTSPVVRPPAANREKGVIRESLVEGLITEGQVGLRETSQDDEAPWGADPKPEDKGAQEKGSTKVSLLRCRAGGEGWKVCRG